VISRSVYRLAIGKPPPKLSMNADDNFINFKIHIMVQLLTNR